MSNNPLALLQQGGQLVVPAHLQALVPAATSSALRENVGSGAAVISIKGKTFGIKHAGKNTQLTVNMNGQLYAAPFMDVVIIDGNPNLSKTYYRDGFVEGADSQPDCWSEDGRVPLAPLAQRPLNDFGQHCTRCDECPLNRFGSKANTETGSKGKACADTRKLAVVPVITQADGSRVIDFHNEKFGGPMLLRVPAASLSVLRDYDVAVSGMGLPFYFVTTRMAFDAAVAYPKLQLQATSTLTEAEAKQVLTLRDSVAVKSILAQAQSGEAPTAAEAHAAIAAPNPAVTATATPVQAAPMAAPVSQTVEQLLAPPPAVAAAPPPAPVATPIQPAPASNVVPIQAAVVAAPAPVVAAPPPPAPAPAPAPAEESWPAGYTQGPAAQYTPAQYKAGNWTVEQMVANQVIVPLAAAPQPAAVVPPAAAPAQAAPTASPGLLASVDALLGQ